jgi:MFS family permease
MTFGRLTAAYVGWLARWRSVLPLFLAETIVWLGFGAMLPVLPLYFTQQGVDLATLGVVTAAWPAARLVGEPVFGWLADRTARVPLMVGGLVATGVLLALPLAVHGAVAFLVLRALAGLATSVYDPAARGVLMDATPPERQGEAFGWYGAAQMTGLLLGPAIGALGASALESVTFVFWFGGLSAGIAAIAVALAVQDAPRRGSVPSLPSSGVADFTREVPHVEDVGPRDANGMAANQTVGLAGDALGDAASDGGYRRTDRPSRLLNPLLIAALIVNAGGYYGAGTYDVIWSLFLTDKGASLELIGFTFMMFSLPVLAFGPGAGRLVDRRGSLAFVVAASVAVAIASTLYTIVPGPAWTLPILILEAIGFAFLNPALYAIVARGSPAGRSSTAQGLFGAAGTVGFVIASLATGFLATMDLRYPFYVFTIVMLASLGLSLVVGRRAILAGEPGRLRSTAPETVRSS